MSPDQQAGNVRRRGDADALWESRRAEILQLYFHDDLTQVQLARHYGVVQTAIFKVFKRLGIKSKHRGSTGSARSRYIHGMRSTVYRTLVKKDVCAKCGATENLCVHHKNGDHQDNSIDNLEVLCSPCHTRHHKPGMVGETQGSRTSASRPFGAGDMSEPRLSPKWLRKQAATDSVILIAPNHGTMLADMMEIADESAWCLIERETLQRGPEWRDLSTVVDPDLPAATNRRIEENIVQAVRYLDARGLLERHPDKPELVRFVERSE